MNRDIILLATTSTQDSGILDVLVKSFGEKTGCRVKTIVAGSGDVLKQGSQGEGDVLLTHSPEAEKEWMQQGYGDSRRLVMVNDFLLIGPANDPAKAKGKPAVDAFRAIAEKGAGFLSRGDQSGTHIRELSVWKRAGIDPKGKSWYRETGQGQGLTMDVASQQQAYTLTDRGTFFAQQKRLSLAVMVEGDASLLNIYHVMTVNSKKFPKVNAQGAAEFADFLVSAETERLIGSFGREKYGRPLFIPASDKSEEQLVR